MSAIILIPYPPAIFAYVFINYFLSRPIINLDRQPVPKTPKHYGMEFQNIEFKVADGAKIKGWLILGSCARRNYPWTEPSDTRGFYEKTPSTKEFFWLE